MGARLKKVDILGVLAVLRIRNNYELLTHFGEKGRDVAVEYVPESRGRPGGWSHTRAFSPRFKTDPDAHWHFNGCAHINGVRAESYQSMLDWASKQYGITEWAPSPFGGHVPAPVMVAALAAVKKHVAHRRDS